MLRHVGRRTAIFTAERETLDQPQGDEQDWRRPPDGLELRQEAHCERRPAHEQDRHEEGVLAADEVADAAEDDGAERANEEARRISRECR